MPIKIGNAPCSWGVEFANDLRNPDWVTVLDECRDAGYKGIELGPIGFMPEDTNVLSDALGARELELIGGVVFKPFHDINAWDDVLDATHRTCKALAAHGAEHLVLIDSISDRRASTAGRANEAEQMDAAEWKAFVERIREAALIGGQEYGLTVGIHAHAGGFVDFEPELERLLDEIDQNILKICFDTGHHTYAGYDPVMFMEKYINRISYLHFKDINPVVKADVIAKRNGFYDACGQGIFCNLGDGDVDFNKVRQVLLENGFEGWCTVEQDCDPTLDVSPYKNALANRHFLETIGFH